MAIRKLKIPKSFELAGQTIAVKHVENLTDSVGNEVMGLAGIAENTVFIRKPSKNIPVAEDQLLLTFYHERIHMIAAAMGWTELNNCSEESENKVDAMANLMLQAVKTAKH